MQYQGNEIYLEDGTYWAMPINADGTLDKANIAEATETPEVILALALAESREDRADPLFVYEEGEEGAYTLSLFSYYGELPIAEGMGETVLAAAEKLVESIKYTTDLLKGV